MIRVAVALVIALGLAGAFEREAAAQPKRLHTSEVTGGPRESEAPIVELLTFGEGERIFEKFGHAALCLRYHDIRLSPVCFNYGVTNFDDGMKLVWGFLRSEQAFWVEPSSWANMVGFYQWEDRDIWRQTLPLSDAEARALESDLWDSLREDRRFYYYDHFLDNCSTRLRDMLDKATGKLRPDSGGEYPFTFRELGRRGLAETPALLAITDFVAGRQLDDHPTLWQAMFHPEIFRSEVERRFDAPPELIYKRRGFSFPQDGASGRDVVLAIALVFVLPLLVARSRRRLRIAIDAAFAAVLAYLLLAISPIGVGATAIIGAVFAIPIVLAHLLARRGESVALVWATLFAGVAGLVVWSLAIVSPIDGLRWNEAVLVLTPLDLAVPFLGRLRRRYAQVRVGLLVLVSLLCTVGILHQPLWVPILVAFLPMAIVAFELPNSIAGAKQSDPMIDTAERAA